MTESRAPIDTYSADSAGPDAQERAPRRLRADARRNIDSLLQAATTVFATSGVDTPPKGIADLAGVGVGTLYRHFPRRSDLVKAVVQREIAACAEAAPALSASTDSATGPYETAMYAPRCVSRSTSRTESSGPLFMARS